MKHVWTVIGRADQQLLLTISGVQRSWLNRCFLGITSLGGVRFQILLSLLLLLIPTTRSAGLVYAFIQLIVTGSVQLLKRRVARHRPYQRFAQISPLRKEHDSSFPSGHTAAACASAMVIAVYLPEYALAGFLLASLVGYSRVYIGVHYPSDVMVGALIGLVLTKLLLLVFGGGSL